MIFVLEISVVWHGRLWEQKWRHLVYMHRGWARCKQKATLHSRAEEVERAEQHLIYCDVLNLWNARSIASRSKFKRTQGKDLFFHHCENVHYFLSVGHGLLVSFGSSSALRIPNSTIKRIRWSLFNMFKSPENFSFIGALGLGSSAGFYSKKNELESLTLSQGKLVDLLSSGA